MEYKVFTVDPTTLKRIQDITDKQKELSEKFVINDSFENYRDFIEINFYSLNGTLLLTDSNYTNYIIPQGALTTNKDKSSRISINPVKDKQAYLLGNSDVKIVYNILSKVPQKNVNFFISNISEDRTEVMLDTLVQDKEEVIKGIKEFIEEQESSSYVNQYGIDTGNGEKVTGVNIQVFETDKETVIMKLSSPLEDDIEVNQTVTIFEKVSDSIAFEVDNVEDQEEEKIRYLKGPNFNIETEQRADQETDSLSYDELFSIDTQNTSQEAESKLYSKSIDLGIDYSDFENFINYSSVEERLYNFKYKLGLIETYNQAIDEIDSGSLNDGGKTKEYYENLKQGIVRNLDHYEEFLYFDNNDNAWPKVNNIKPYQNTLTTSTVAQQWFNNKIDQAQIYDSINTGRLIKTIPSYISEDPINQPYLTFIDMIGQQFDNLWIYTKEVTSKYNNDNRLDIGISKELLETVLTNFGIKVFESGTTVENLFKYFVEDSYTGNEEVITTLIDEGEKVSGDRYKKEIYKRIYHNLPLLLKSKGTERGVKALISCFGIPSDTLVIRQYGGNTETVLDRFGLNENQSGALGKIVVEDLKTIQSSSQLSEYTSIQEEKENTENELPKVEIGFEINRDVNQVIIDSLGVDFNIDNYIGDPLQKSDHSYEELERLLKNAITPLDRFNTKDFIRLIKFFDNSLFRIVKEFIPGKINANTGILVKQPALSRNKTKDIAITFEDRIHDSKIKILETSGSHGESIQGTTDYKNIVQTPTGKVTKKWYGPLNGYVEEVYLEGRYTVDTGSIQYHRSAEEAKYDGVLSGSIIELTNGELNEENPFKKVNYIDITYDLRFLSYLPTGVCVIGYRDTPTIYKESTGDNISSVDLRTVFENYNNTFNIEINGILVSQSAPAGEDTVDDFDLSNIIPTTNNYGTASIKIEKPGIETPPQDEPTQTGCYLETDLQAIYCRITPDLVAIENGGSISQFETYDITQYVNGLDINTQNTFYEILPNSTEQVITDPTQYTIIEPSGRTEGSTIEIRIEDNIDTNCTTIIGLSFNSCPLQNRYEPGDLFPLNIIPYRVPVNDSTGVRNIFSRAYVTREESGVFLPLHFILPDNINPILGAQTNVAEGTYARFYIDTYRGDSFSGYTFDKRVYLNFSGTDPGDVTSTIFPSGVGTGTPADLDYTRYVDINVGATNWPDLTFYNSGYVDSNYKKHLTVAANYNDLVARNDELQFDINSKTITRFSGRETILPSGSLTPIQDLIDLGEEEIGYRVGVEIEGQCYREDTQIRKLKVLPQENIQGENLNSLGQIDIIVVKQSETTFADYHCANKPVSLRTYDGQSTIYYASLDNTFSTSMINTIEYVDLPQNPGVVQDEYVYIDWRIDGGTCTNGGSSGTEVYYSVAQFKPVANRPYRFRINSHATPGCILCNTGDGGTGLTGL